ncbi:hypothetical protein BOX15_Mlig027847g2, partial [Macrostomum lignano]
PFVLNILLTYTVAFYRRAYVKVPGSMLSGSQCRRRGTKARDAPATTMPTEQPARTPLGILSQPVIDLSATCSQLSDSDRSSSSTITPSESSALLSDPSLDCQLTIGLSSTTSRSNSLQAEQPKYSRRQRRMMASASNADAQMIADDVPELDAELTTEQLLDLWRRQTDRVDALLHQALEQRLRLLLREERVVGLADRFGSELQTFAKCSVSDNGD